MLSQPVDFTSPFIKIVPKGWGEEKWICNSPLYCAKLLIVNKGKRCSIHFHERKHETFFIQVGSVLLELEGQSKVLVAGQIVHISPYQHHRFTGVSDVDAIIFEVSTQHFEFDSIRVEKGD